MVYYWGDFIPMDLPVTHIKTKRKTALLRAVALTPPELKVLLLNLTLIFPISIPGYQLIL
jgi:hypothetical protein